VAKTVSAKMMAKIAKPNASAYCLSCTIAASGIAPDAKAVVQRVRGHASPGHSYRRSGRQPKTRPRLRARPGLA